MKWSQPRIACHSWPFQWLFILTALIWTSAGAAQTSFTRATEGPVATDLVESTGCAWGDYDGDGWLDLFVATRSDAGEPNMLYRNNRDGTFSHVTSTPITEPGDWSHPGLWIDYDNDGDLDLFAGQLMGRGNRLYRNDGLGQFTKISAQQSGTIVQAGHHSISGSWADFDNDGWVDLFVANGALTESAPDFLHRNLGNGTFSDSAERSGISLALRSNQGIWADIDDDGDIDLFVTHFTAPNHLYLNRGDGTFTPITSGHVLNEVGPCTGAAWGDYDNDGRFDLVVLKRLRRSLPPEKNLLYRNLGDGEFEKVNSSAITAELGHNVSCSWGDYDNDGWLDLFISRDVEPNLLFRNNGDGDFTRVDEAPGSEHVLSGSCAWADYNNDGFLDLFVANGASTGPQQNLLYRNNGNGNHWLKLRLRGTRSNRSAVGAKVRLGAMIKNKMLWQFRQVSAGEGWLSQGPLEVHFGLSDASKADVVRIEWPSGEVQELGPVAANQVLSVIEPSHLAWSQNANGVRQLSLHGGVNNAYQIEASNDLSTWTLIGRHTITGANGVISVALPAEPHPSKQFYRAALANFEKDSAR